MYMLRVRGRTYLSLVVQYFRYKYWVLYAGTFDILSGVTTVFMFVHFGTTLRLPRVPVTTALHPSVYLRIHGGQPPSRCTC